MGQKSGKGKRDIWVSLFVSIVFFTIYFAIHAVINAYTGLKASDEERTFGDLLGPFTISLCSSLVIFSYATFVSQGMRHLSIVYPDVFFKSFLIFVISLIIIQIAGHAEILNLSGHEQMPQWLSYATRLLSFFLLPITFASLLWLEKYQELSYEKASSRLPPWAHLDHDSHKTVFWCTIASIVLSIIKHFLDGKGWVFWAELALAAIVVKTTFSSHTKRLKAEEEASKNAN
jgi:hypothetical protein